MTHAGPIPDCDVSFEEVVAAKVAMIWSKLYDLNVLIQQSEARLAISRSEVDSFEISVAFESRPLFVRRLSANVKPSWKFLSAKMALKDTSEELDGLHRTATHLRGELMTVTCVVLRNPRGLGFPSLGGPLSVAKNQLEALLASIKDIV